MKVLQSVALLIITLISMESSAQVETTLIFVRHAEKSTGNDPELSQAGHERAQRLVETLRDLDIAAIYSTPFNRTRQTVAPISKARNIAVTEYAASTPYGLFVSELLAKHKGKTVLVAGHSNTVPGMADAAFGKSSDIVIAEEDYGNIVIVKLREGADAKLERSRY